MSIDSPGSMKTERFSSTASTELTEFRISLRDIRKQDSPHVKEESSPELYAFRENLYRLADNDDLPISYSWN